MLDQAIVANTKNVPTIYLGGVIAHLSGQAGFVSLPADGSAHSLSIGAAWMHEGAIAVVFRLTSAGARVAAIQLIADPAALARTSLEREPPSASK